MGVGTGVPTVGVRVLDGVGLMVAVGIDVGVNERLGVRVTVGLGVGVNGGLTPLSTTDTLWMSAPNVWSS